MIKLLFYLCTGLAAFGIGILPGYLDAYSSHETPRVGTNEPDQHFRSCQVKQVKTNGRIVWMSCDEWRKAEK